MLLLEPGIPSSPDSWSLTLPPSSHKPLNCYTLGMQPPLPAMFSILLVKSYLAVYALLQSKDSRRAKTIYQFPRLFSSVIATIVLLWHQHYAKIPGAVPRFKGTELAAWTSLLSPTVLLGGGGKHASSRKARLPDLKREKENHSDK